MQTITVTCNQCGAPLEVGDAARFVTCKYCKAQLEVKRSDSAVYTEVLSRIDQRTEQIAQDVRALREAHEGGRADPETVREAFDAVHATTRGARVMGSPFVIVFGLIFGSVGIFFAVSSRTEGAPIIFTIVGSGFALFGLVIVVSGIVGATGGFKKKT